MQLKFFAVHGNGDISEQAVLQAQVHDALYHAARVRSVSECVPQEVVLLSDRAPDTEASLLTGLHLGWHLRRGPQKQLARLYIYMAVYKVRKQVCYLLPLLW